MKQTNIRVQISCKKLPCYLTTLLYMINNISQIWTWILCMHFFTILVTQLLHSHHSIDLDLGFQVAIYSACNCTSMKFFKQQHQSSGEIGQPPSALVAISLGDKVRKWHEFTAHHLSCRNSPCSYTNKVSFSHTLLEGQNIFLKMIEFF